MINIRESSFEFLSHFQMRALFNLKLRICNRDSKNKDKIAKYSKLQIHIEFEPLQILTWFLLHLIRNSISFDNEYSKGLGIKKGINASNYISRTNQFKGMVFYRNQVHSYLDVMWKYYWVILNSFYIKEFFEKFEN